MADWLTTNDALQRCGITRQTLLVWQRKGLVHPKRESRGRGKPTNLYDPAELDRCARASGHRGRDPSQSVGYKDECHSSSPPTGAVVDSIGGIDPEDALRRVWSLLQTAEQQYQAKTNANLAAIRGGKLAPYPGAETERHAATLLSAMSEARKMLNDLAGIQERRGQWIATDKASGTIAKAVGLLAKHLDQLASQAAEELAQMLAGRAAAGEPLPNARELRVILETRIAAGRSAMCDSLESLTNQEP